MITIALILGGWFLVSIVASLAFGAFMRGAGR